MPIVKNQAERLQKINERLNRWGGQPVSKAELLRLCHCSERTLRTDLERLRDEGASIQYDARRRGYFYAEPFDWRVPVSLSDRDLAALQTAVSTLSDLSHLEPFRDLRGVVDKLERAVQFRFLKSADEGRFLQLERVPYVRGGNLIAPLLRAARNQQLVCFQHQRFDAGTVRVHRLVPYLIKEHRNRWYVIGWQPDYAEIRVYGLDRIVPDSLQLGPENTDAPDFDAAAYFRHSLGVAVYLDQQPEEVVLSFTARQGRYFRALPFFPFESGDVLIDSETEFRVRLRLIANEELLYELARLGPDVKVLTPTALADKLQAYLRAAYEQYAGHAV